MKTLRRGFHCDLIVYLGENAFWSLGGKITEQLIGTNFGKLNKGLAQAC